MNYREKFDHWFPKYFLSGVAAICVCRYVLYKDPEAKVQACMKHHESIHQKQMDEHGILGFYLKYLWQWITSGFSYYDIKFEQEAFEAQDKYHAEVCKGPHYTL